MFWLTRLRTTRRPVVATALSLLALVVLHSGNSDGAPAALAQTTDPVLAGAGDIADCNTPGDEATARLLDGIGGTVFTAGDNAYPDGTTADFANCYGPTWGRHKARTRPAPGNSDYASAAAAPYFNYFGTNAGPAGRGYYSYFLGDWLIISLNSEIDTSAASAQVQWLRATLAANPRMCTLAYWHRPLFSSGKHGNDSRVRPLFQALYDYGTDVVINGHDHDYERFSRQNPYGRLDSTGIREFVVGTGGRYLYSFGAIQPNSMVRSATHGVLKLSLHSTSYDWRFVPTAGKTFTDSGSAGCVSASGRGGRVLTFHPTDDATLIAGSPASNHGAATFLETDGQPEKHFLLKFPVSGVSTGRVASAKLRIFAVDPSDRGGDFRRVADTTWEEETVTWNTAPGADSGVIASLGTVSSGRWYEVDVTSLIRGDGVVSVKVSSNSSNGADYSSKEGSNPPQLIVTVSDS